MNGAILATDQIYQNVINYLFNPLLKLAIVLISLYFLYGVLRYIFAMSKGGTNDEINHGRSHMLWGLVGLLIIFSINGIFFLLSSTVGSFFR